MRLSDLEKYNEIVIQMHDNPDADAVGSGYALYTYFKEKGKQVRLVYGGTWQIQKSNMLLMIKELDIPVEYVTAMEAPELLLTVDCQYGEGNVWHFDARNIAMIDHHNTGRESGDMAEIRSHIVSCATICYDMLRKEGYDVNRDKRVATALYYGMFMDSNELSELRHPLERDMLDALHIDKKLVKRLVYSNFSIQEMETAGIAMIRFNYDENKRLSIIRSKPCDPNILGLIGDFVLKVDNIDVSIIFNERPDGYKLSLRSCVPEVGVNDMADFLTDGIGNGGGHNDKAGGFISRKKFVEQYGEMSIETYFFNRINEYYSTFDIIYARDGLGNREGFALYEKQPYPYGFVRSTELFDCGEECRIRTYEGDVLVTVSEDLYLMIGCEGEVYPIEKRVFEEKYTETEQPFQRTFEYAPSVYRFTDSKVYSLMDRARECICVPGAKIYAKQLDKPSKVFTRWDYEKYMYGEAGDYLCHTLEDESDIYVIKKRIFDKTYVKCEC